MGEQKVMQLLVVSDMHIPTFKDSAFVETYKQYLCFRYHLTHGTIAVESPKDFLRCLLTFLPELVCDQPRSAQQFMSLCLYSSDLHNTGNGIILGYKADTLRREYDRMKRDNFSDLLRLHPTQTQWFSKQEAEK